MLKKCMAVWNEAHVESKVLKTEGLGPLFDVKMPKKCMRCGRKHVSKSTFEHTHTTFGPLLDMHDKTRQQQLQLQLQQQLQLQLQLHYSSTTTTTKPHHTPLHYATLHYYYNYTYTNYSTLHRATLDELHCTTLIILHCAKYSYNYTTSHDTTRHYTTPPYTTLH